MLKARVTNTDTTTHIQVCITQSFDCLNALRTDGLINLHSYLEYETDESKDSVAGKVTDNVNWKHVLIGNFNYLRDNIDPMYLRNKLYDEDFLPRSSVKIRKSERRYIKSTLVMIAVAKKIRDKSSFIKFKDILRKYQYECCAVMLEKQPYAATDKKDCDD
ncbi:Hypothetical predicted protein [Mytilus galloprovincialis]|uniref:Uncharacterized protein n=1 Tax=Mytilus galloprovincialis TaxID=29158 RepID=A0A8B6EY91_MYTGA|nr:Hypothetical predicted protein [Mytilus galloprovincialis]